MKPEDWIWSSRYSRFRALKRKEPAETMGEFGDSSLGGQGGYYYRRDLTASTRLGRLAPGEDISASAPVDLLLR